MPTDRPSAERQLAHIKRIVRTAIKEGERERESTVTNRSTSYRRQLVMHSEGLLRVDEYLGRGSGKAKS